MVHEENKFELCYCLIGIHCHLAWYIVLAPTDSNETKAFRHFNPLRILLVDVSTPALPP